MFQVLESIKNIKSFSVSNDMLFYKDSKNFLFKNGVELISNIEDFFVYNDILIYNKNGIGHIYKILSKLDKKIEGKIIISFKGLKNKEVFFTDVETNRELILFNLSNFLEKVILKTYNWEFLFLEREFVFIYHKFIISVFCLASSTQNWQTDLSLYGEIRKIVGVVEDNLWVTLTKSVEQENGLTDFEETLVVIHTKTGSITNVFVHNYLFSSVGVLLNDAHQTIVSLKEKMLIIYDAKKGKEITKKEVLSLKAQNYNVRYITIFEDKIYFTCNDGSQVVPNILGVLDYHTLEILWSTKIPYGTNEAPKVTKDKLYIKNTENELYIFERDKEAV